MPVLDTLSHYGSSLSLSSTRCACPRYAVPVLNTLSWPFAVPVPLRNRILTLIPLYTFCRSLLWIRRRTESSIYKFPVATVMPKKGGMQVENTEEQLQKDVICQGVLSAAAHPMFLCRKE